MGQRGDAFLALGEHVMEDHVFNLRHSNWRWCFTAGRDVRAAVVMLELAEPGMVMAAERDRQPREMVLPGLLDTGQRG